MGPPQGLSSHPGQAAAAAGFASLDAATIKEQKSKAMAYLELQSERALDLAKQQLDAQKQMLELESERATQLETQKISAKRDHDLMMLEQTLQQQKMVVESAYQNKLMEIEQAAMALQAQAAHRSCRRRCTRSWRTS